MASDGLSDLQKMELKEAFDEFDKVTFTQVTNPNIFFILKGVSILNVLFLEKCISSFSIYFYNRTEAGL